MSQFKSVADRLDAIAQHSKITDGGEVVTNSAMEMFLNRHPAEKNNRNDDYDSIKKKYRTLKHQHNILDKAARSAITEQNECVRENKRLKFELAKEHQTVELKKQEIKQLQDLVVSVQNTMTEFASQAKKDREEAVSEAIREYGQKKTM